jgi:hypothetical protein
MVQLAVELTWHERLDNYRRVMGNDPYIASTDVPQGDLEPDLAIVPQRSRELTLGCSMELTH